MKAVLASFDGNSIYPDMTQPFALLQLVTSTISGNEKPAYAPQCKEYLFHSYLNRDIGYCSFKFRLIELPQSATLNLRKRISIRLDTSFPNHHPFRDAAFLIRRIPTP